MTRVIRMDDARDRTSDVRERGDDTRPRIVLSRRRYVLIILVSISFYINKPNLLIIDMLSCIKLYFLSVLMHFIA